MRHALEALVSGRQSPAQMLAIQPRIIDGIYALGRDALARGRASDAEAFFLRCVQLDARRSDAWLGLASARQALGRVLEAAELFQFAALFAQDVTPMAYAAACFALEGQHARAQSLAAHVRSSLADVSSLTPWLTIAEAHT